MPDELDEALDLLVERAMKRTATGRRRTFGYSEAQLAAHEAKLGRAIPSPLRHFYRRVDRALCMLATDDDDTIRLSALKDACWTSAKENPSLVWAITEYEASVVGEWRNAEYFSFGSLVFGDELLLCPRPPNGMTDCVVLADHEADDPVVVLGESLAHWVTRFVRFGCVELAYSSDAIPNRPAEEQRAFLEDHRRLNPSIEWVHRSLMLLDHPQGHPLGYHHWDKARRALVPIAEASGVRDIILDKPSPVEMTSLKHAKDCRWLSISADGALDLATVAALPRLTHLALYGASPVDFAPLAGASALTRVEARRCCISNIAALGRAPVLKLLELGAVEAPGLGDLRRLRPDVRIDVRERA